MYSRPPMRPSTAHLGADVEDGLQEKTPWRACSIFASTEAKRAQARGASCRPSIKTWMMFYRPAAERHQVHRQQQRVPVRVRAFVLPLAHVMLVRAMRCQPAGVCQAVAASPKDIPEWSRAMIK